MQNQNVRQAVYSNLSRIFIWVKAKPGSKKKGISSISDTEISVSIQSPPVDGKANSALIEYFAEIFNLSKSDVIIEKGGTSKNKLISISNVYSESEVYGILNQNLI